MAALGSSRMWNPCSVSVRPWQSLQPLRFTSSTPRMGFVVMGAAIHCRPSDTCAHTSVVFPRRHKATGGDSVKSKVDRIRAAGARVNEASRAAKQYQARKQQQQLSEKEHASANRETKGEKGKDAEDDRPMTPLRMRAEEYLERQREMGYGATGSSGSTLTGLQMMAENRIQEAMRRGAFDNLKHLEGKPLPDRAHSVTPFGVTEDYEMFKILAKSGVKPEVFERNNELREVVPRVREQLRDAIKRRMAAGLPVDAAAMEKETGEGCRTFAEIFAETNTLIRQYNDAWLKDSETLRGGRALPLHQRQLLDMEREVRAVMEGDKRKK